MIIKLNPTFYLARQKEEKVSKPLTIKQKVKADRVLMLILLILSIVGAVVMV